MQFRKPLKRFSRFDLGPLIPNRKLGENEKFNFLMVSKAGGFAAMMRTRG